MGRSTARREEILTVAGELFRQKGYHATSMQDIAERLQLQRGSLYAHIESKEELLFEIVDRAADRFLAGIEQAWREGTTARDRLRRALAAHMAVIAEHRDTASVFFHEWRFLRADLRSRIQAKRDRYEARWRELIADGVARGEFRAVDPRFAALLALSAVNWAYQWYSPDGPLAPDDVAATFAELILKGLEAGSS
ncbi:TetR/AcrR family transcriptional regulator [Thermaerobacter subterraneus]|uniref:Transcriptional regulator n=1 Tax=Thermaerobacter subterraneus DSM 13965 TaxID=867903 RepID=K6Q1J9_9FIRM|nr:TetR/AcrR family transcriptional regulator [Thermaerobacter subterraneus]EKP95008.1 transcriptional regulator [Thermaerobacter subterraneus DSM 13965]